MKQKIFIFLAIVFSSHLQGYSELANDSNLFYSNCQLADCSTYSCDFFKIAKIEFGSASGKYIGIRHGYNELGLFATSMTPNNTAFFIEARGFLLYNHDWVANLGLGFRKPICTPYSIILGANIYYDYENAKFWKEEDSEEDSNDCHLKSLRHSFGSLGFGFEILSNCIDFRTNVYLPIKKEFNTKSTFSYPGGYLLSLNRQYYIHYGIDAEVSKRFNLFSQFNAIGTLGTYAYFHKHTENIYGLSTRIEFWWRDYLSLQGRYSYDHQFHSNFQAKILLSLPLDKIAYGFYECCAICFDPLTQPIQRNYIPFIQKRCCWDWNW